MKVTVIPLDSRPCNYSWVKKYCNYASIDIAIPEIEKTGDLHKGFDTEGLYPWLMEHCKESDALLVSIDAITSGGLIQARQGQFSLETAVKHVEYLRSIKEHYPNMKIYAFDTIMRTSITAYDDETARYWAYINEYSKLLGLDYFEPSDEYKKRLAELKALIPGPVLKGYLDARDKKHVINKLMINLSEDNIIDYCVLLQEDTQPSGIQVIENNVLKEMVQTKKLADKVSIYNGTDEGTVVLLAKLLHSEQSVKPSIHFLFPYEELKHKVMKFEDREVYENCQRLANVIGFEMTSIEDADYIIAVYTEKENYDLDLGTSKEVPLSNEKVYKNFIKSVNDYIQKGRQVALVDLLHPNGGSLELLQEINYQDLLAYSAWNTASNSLGSLLGLIGVHGYNPKSDLDDFLYERIIDDCFYQTVVRRKVNQNLVQQGHNIFDLGEDATEVLGKIDALMKIVTLDVKRNNFKLTLPWNRTFEIDIDME